MTANELIDTGNDRHFRTVLGNFCSGITVLASTVDGSPVGLTCQSFFSVSLAPPLIAFSVMESSTTYPLVRRAGTCCVNVLAGDQRPLSNQFARSGTDKWAGVEWHPSPGTGDPIIRDVLAWLECEIEWEHGAGDHTIVVARVRSFGSRPDAAPLLYFRGDYAQVENAEFEKDSQR
jgi:3-hydroxy-9,10-secoandrosta-1,3,5(10)-triene-9,17-dione monooxygenase reductase component